MYQPIFSTLLDDVRSISIYKISERDPVLIERSNLVNISKLVVKEVSMPEISHCLTLYMFQVIESSLKFGRQLDSDHIPLQHFFIVLEHVLRHGLRPKKVTSKFKIRKMTNWQTEVKLMKMVNFLILPNKSHKSHLLRLKGKQINSFLFGLYWIFL